MTIIVTTDLHFTARAQDAYRLPLLKWLKEQVESTGATDVLILGDVTDFKDGHCSSLVNAISEGFIALAEVADVHILKGNHDYVDAATPFFGFLGRIDGISYYKDITKVGSWLFLPHTRTPEADWSNLDFTGIDTVFMHESVIGSVTSESYKMEHGLSHTFLAKWPKRVRIISGDIHLPQVCGRVEYVGSPYRVRLGDSFEPRVMVIGSKGDRDLKFPCINKMTVVIKTPEELLDFKINEGDQVKVRLKINKASYPEWATMKQDVVSIGQDLGIDLKGVELITSKRRKSLKSKEAEALSAPNSKDVLLKFSEIEKVDDYTTKVGVGLIS